MAGKTIDIIKKTRTVSEKLKQEQKEYRSFDKPILKALKDGPKTIPQIAKEIDMAMDVVVYHLMGLRKIGKVEVGEIDDMDEYYFYKLKK